jgi:hypothetical protein
VPLAKGFTAGFVTAAVFAAGFAAGFGTVLGAAGLGSGFATLDAGFATGLAAAARTGFLPGEALDFLLIWMPAGSGPGPWKRTRNYTGNKGF